MSGKLSRHVLGMKFMRRTKDQIDKSGNPNVSSPNAGSSAKIETSSIKNESSVTTAKPVSQIEEVWSYNQCERYIFGRQSYGGFNPVVEKNVKKGIWKPFYLEDGVKYESSDGEDVKIQSDVDVSDEEMAKTYGSLIGTLAKRFQKKWKDGKGKNKKNPKQNPSMKKKSKFSTKDFMKAEEEESEEDDSEEEGEVVERPSQKRPRESTGSTHHQNNSHRRGSPRKRNHGGSNQSVDPPHKKRKFMKPSD